ncbi:MAG: Na+/H+ antiporter subunit E [Anaerosomatales bacterium]|jgi:multicomponent Na+:H+ antiporter subunit E|nr:Na+/H+ antiporter subunit E [Anaerosomatales bacterium]
MRARGLVGGIAALIVAWIAIAGVDPKGVLFGAAAAVVAAAMLAPMTGFMPRPRPAGLARFAAYFVAQSVTGGVDVALRALSPRMKLDPGWIRYPMRLTAPGLQAMFADCISLLPGTLCARIEGGAVEVHALDRSADLRASLETLEQRLSDAFAEPVGRGPQ